MRKIRSVVLCGDIFKLKVTRLLFLNRLCIYILKNFCFYI